MGATSFLLRLRVQSIKTADASLRGHPAGSAAGCYAALVTQDGPDSGPALPGAAGPAEADGTGSAGDPVPGVLDLLGLLAYAELVAFFRLTDDAALAVSLADKTALAEMAVAEFGHFQLLRRPGSMS